MKTVRPISNNVNNNVDTPQQPQDAIAFAAHDGGPGAAPLDHGALGGSDSAIPTAVEKIGTGSDSGTAAANPITPTKHSGKSGCAALNSQEILAVRAACLNPESGIPPVARLLLLLQLDTGLRQGDLRHLTYGMLSPSGQMQPGAPGLNAATLRG